MSYEFQAEDMDAVAHVLDVLNSIENDESPYCVSVNHVDTFRKDGFGEKSTITVDLEIDIHDGHWRGINGNE